MKIEDETQRVFTQAGICSLSPRPEHKRTEPGDVRAAPAFGTSLHPPVLGNLSLHAGRPFFVDINQKRLDFQGLLPWNVLNRHRGLRHLPAQKKKKKNQKGKFGSWGYECIFLEKKYTTFNRFSKGSAIHKLKSM